MGCFSGRLMSAASDQKLFCELCSPFNCSFDEFVGEKVVSPSYSSAILTPPNLYFLIPSIQFSSVQSLSHVWIFVTPWTAACQASLSTTNSWSLLKFMSIELVMPSNHLILCHPLLVSQMTIATSAFLFSFAWNIFFISSLSVCISLALKWVHFKKHVVDSYF